MRRKALEAIQAARQAGQAMVRAVDLASGEERLLDPIRDTSALGAAAAEATQADQSSPVEIDGRSWFLTVYNPPLDLVVVGAVHIAQPLCVMAHLASYKVRVIDPRQGFAAPERFPGISITHDWPDEALAQAPLGPRSALAALSHDPKIDDPALVVALRSDCFYVGALGSRKTQASRRERLKEKGFSEVEINRIHGPIGLSIGARSPAEIAISILAEITQSLRQSSGFDPAGVSLRNSTSLG
ncbi:MAG TPA: XdhC family protein [Rhizomicrobium sp.]|nr:XdhC family protein [Rhizomicrobium sp.]